MSAWTHPRRFHRLNWSIVNFPDRETRIKSCFDNSAIIVYSTLTHLTLLYSSWDDGTMMMMMEEIRMSQACLLCPGNSSVIYWISRELLLWMPGAVSKSIGETHIYVAIYERPGAGVSAINTHPQARQPLSWCLCNFYTIIAAAHSPGNKYI